MVLTNVGKLVYPETFRCPTLGTNFFKTSQEVPKGKLERLLDVEIAEKIKDEYPDSISPSDVVATVRIDKSSHTDLSSMRSDRMESDSDSEQCDEGDRR